MNGYYGIIEDITGMVHAKDEIQRKEEEQSRLLDSVHAFMGHWDKNLINIHANRAYAEVFGKTPAEVKGKHLVELFGPELYADRFKLIENVLKGEPQNGNRFAFQHPQRLFNFGHHKILLRRVDGFDLPEQVEPKT